MILSDPRSISPFDLYELPKNCHAFFAADQIRAILRLHGMELAETFLKKHFAHPGIVLSSKL